MTSSQITVRVPDPVKVLWKEMADREGRSMSNYLERLLLREKERIDQGSETLDTLGIKLNDILEIISENKKRSVKNNKTKEKKETAYDAWEDLGVCTKENWDQWINHVRKMGVPLNHGQAELHFKEFCRFDAEGYDCNVLINEITERYPWKFPYLPKEWKNG